MFIIIIITIIIIIIILYTVYLYLVHLKECVVKSVGVFFVVFNSVFLI